MSLRQLRARLKRLEGRVRKSARSLTTDEERRARAQELGWKWHGWAHPIVDPITVREQRDIDYLKKHYPELAPPHPLADSIKAWEEVGKKYSAESDERMRLRQLERQKKAAAAALINSEADSRHCPSTAVEEEAARLLQAIGCREQHRARLLVVAQPSCLLDDAEVLTGVRLH